MEDSRSYALSGFRQLLKYLETPARYPQVKTAVEYHINQNTLLDCSQPISNNIRFALHFATTSCEARIHFDNGDEEDAELQHMALTALGALDLSFKLEISGYRVASIRENGKKIAEVYKECEEIRKHWYAGIEEESDKVVLYKRRLKLWFLDGVIQMLLESLLIDSMPEKERLGTSQRDWAAQHFNDKYGPGWLLGPDLPL